jgi:hypothetical protein
MPVSPKMIVASVQTDINAMRQLIRPLLVQKDIIVVIQPSLLVRLVRTIQTLAGHHLMLVVRVRRVICVILKVWHHTHKLLVQLVTIVPLVLASLNRVRLVLHLKAKVVCTSCSSVCNVQVVITVVSVNRTQAMRSRRRVLVVSFALLVMRSRCCVLLVRTVLPARSIQSNVQLASSVLSAHHLRNRVALVVIAQPTHCNH